ncbi:alkaline phosphatase family protein [Sphingobacterium puteale]|uniref:alkaline phosphatase family protein n=1 Tax=Sphingobacterium puteale TaxID=2420510 RepID=UPI003D97CE47
MKLNAKFIATVCLAIVAAALYSSCKKYDNPPPVYEEIKDLTASQRKVLVVSIDGLSGADLIKALPANMAKLQKNAKFSYNTLITASSTGGWVSMLTGTGFSKHKISNENFEREQDGSDNEHEDLVYFRNVLDYVTQYKSVTTALITPWKNLRDYVKNSDYAPVVNTDQAVQDSAASLLSKVNNLGTVFVNFKDVEYAGEDGGYTLSNDTYKNAIVQADTRVGKLLEALQTRKNYAGEDWLIIVTTNHGGSLSEPQNGFVIVYNPSFKEFELKKSGFNPVLFNTKTSRAVLDKDNGLYDAGETKSFSVQMDVKFNATPNGYSSFFSKSTNLSGQRITGWQWAYYPGGKWVVTVGGTLNGGQGKQEAASADAPGTTDWHTYTMTVNYVNSSTRNLVMYMDGKQQNSINISNRKSLSTAEAFRIGHREGDNDVVTPFYSANLAYFNTALSEETIQKTMGLTDITKHPNYGNLIGFWPMDEGTEGTFFNTAPGGYNMGLSGGYTWTNLNSFYAPGTKPEPITSVLSIPSTASDIAALTLYWMNIDILADFNYDGKPYLKNFEIEFLK